MSIELKYTKSNIDQKNNFVKKIYGLLLNTYNNQKYENVCVLMRSLSNYVDLYGTIDISICKTKNNLRTFSYFTCNNKKMFQKKMLFELFEQSLDNYDFIKYIYEWKEYSNTICESKCKNGSKCLNKKKSSLYCGKHLQKESKI